MGLLDNITTLSIFFLTVFIHSKTASSIILILSVVSLFTSITFIALLVNFFLVLSNMGAELVNI